jgi:uncharacterized Tic20 family protein
MRLPAADRGVLVTAVAAHVAPLAAFLIIAALIIGAVVAIVLVWLTKKEHRVDAIRAVADVLRALIPWPSRRGNQ